MNKQRRKELADIVSAMENVSTPIDIEELEGIKSDIEMVLMDEEMAFDNMPEGLQYSMRGEASQEAQDNMNEAIDLIDEFISDYGDYEIDQIHDEPVEDDEDEDYEDIESEIEDRLQDLIGEVVSYLETAAE